MKISENFTESEFTRTSTGLPNELTYDATLNLRALVCTILQPLRTLLNCPIFINSGYRSPAVNKAVGGVKNSQHLDGLAADFVATRHDPSYCSYILEYYNLPYDQLIIYDTFVHVSCSKRGIEPRKQIIDKRSRTKE